MQEFLKRAMQFYKVPLSAETEELLHTYQAEIRETVYALEPLLTGKLFKIAARAFGVVVRSAHALLEKYFEKGLLYGIASGAAACRGDEDVSTAIDKAMDSFQKGQIESCVQSMAYRNTKARYMILCRMLGEIAGKEAQTLLLELQSVNEKIICAQWEEFFIDGMQNGLRLGAEAERCAEEI